MEHYLFVEKYRPKTVEDTILPERIKSGFREFVSKKNIPNLILSGGPGVGKTTIARAMLEELGCDYMIINGSLDGNIDTLRTQIKDFASSMSIVGGRKYVILDEADYLTSATQPALRNFMEEFSANCGFILTCNFKHKIIEPLHSRCSTVEFVFTKQERLDLAAQYYKRIRAILETEKIVFDKAAVAEVVKKYFPDFRKTLNELQKYSVSGKIDSGILTDFETVQLKQLVSMMKEKNFTGIRKWSVEAEYDDTTLYRKLYDASANYFTANSIPTLVLILSKYMYQSAFAADKEINTMACLAEIMIECEMK
jgi:DNA polymerase III delta prime subunit